METGRDGDSGTDGIHQGEDIAMAKREMQIWIMVSRSRRVNEEK